MSSYSKFQNKNRKYANSYDLTQKPQKSSKAKDAVMTKDGMEERFIEWVTFYRRNIHRFVQHYFGMNNLNPFQLIWLYLMNICTTMCVVACRGIGKSYLLAIYACAIAVLKPNSKVVIASATKKQASLIVTEKIQKELIPNSPNLAREIKQIKTNANDIEVIFHNGSSIVVVPASENARGYRATLMIYEEFRMIKKDVIDSVLQPFLFVRPAPYINKPEYKHLAEEPMEIYISSAWIKQHWMWGTMKNFVVSMLTKGDTYLLGFDYCLALRHNLKTFKQMKQAKKKSDSLTFAMEYENIMVGENSDAYYTYDLLHKCQTNKKIFYPLDNLEALERKKNKYAIKKQQGEIRVVGVDIAMITKKDGTNDNTVITCIRALPIGDSYERQVCYIEAFNGGNTTEQSIRIKEIFSDFEGDYLCLDTQNAGISVADELGKVTYDERRDCEYPAWKSFNDENTASRIKISNALPIIYSIKGNAGLNHQIHLAMKDVLEKRKMKLMINSIEGRNFLEEKKDYITSSPEKKAWFEMPMLQGDLLINEMVNLSYVINESSKTIKLVEPRNGTKDRYISLSYTNFFIKQLEQDLQAEEETDLSQIPSCVSSINFSL